MAEWRDVRMLSVPMTFVCGYCDHEVAAREGYSQMTGSGGGGSAVGYIYICPGCGKPSYFRVDTWPGSQTPAPRLGNAVTGLPPDIEAIYSEARQSTMVHAYTAVVLICRKLLMHVAVELGAPAGKSFVSYVEYLCNENYVPRGSKGWVDEIRTKGNEANHELVLFKAADAEDLLNLCEMLLKLNYEFPARAAVSKAPEEENQDSVWAVRRGRVKS